MALPSDHIYIPDLLNLLGIISNPANVGAACIAENINKWSKYKPIRDTGPGPNWPAGSNSKYGFNLPANWDYLKPRGGAVDEWYRPSDFRGYEHDLVFAFPTMHIKSTEKTVQNLHPTNGPVSNTWKIRTYREASNVLITPANLGLDNYYYCIKIWGASVPTMYRTIGQVSAGLSAGIDFSVHANYDFVQGSFFDLPLGSGIYNYLFLIASTATPYSGGAYRWTTIAPSDLIALPHEGNYINTGSFNVSKFIYVTNPAPAWIYSAYGAGNAIRVYIGANNSFKYTSVPASDLTGWTIKNKETTQIGENEQGANGDYLDIYPNYSNDAGTDKTENLVIVSEEDASVTQTISLRQYRNTSPPPPYVGMAPEPAWQSKAGFALGLSRGSQNWAWGGSQPYVVYYDYTHNAPDVITCNAVVTDQNNIEVGRINGFALEPDMLHLAGGITINRQPVDGDTFTITLYYLD
jgi:hypothetical protein